MSVAGVAATRLLVEDALRIVRGMSDEDWAADSACVGWRVQDVLVHMGVFFQSLSDPASAIPADERSGLAERINDAAVAHRKDWLPAEAAAYYEQQAATGLAVIESFQSPDLAEVTMPVAELGTYRLSELSNAFAFDHLVHLSCDILAPFGPVGQDPVPVDDARLAPALDWMLSGLPKMCGTALRPVLRRPLGVDLSGPAGVRFELRPGDDGPTLVRLGDTDPLPDDVIGSSTVDFLRWSTTRTDWRAVTAVTGDAAFVAAVADAINIV